MGFELRNLFDSANYFNHLGLDGQGIVGHLAQQGQNGYDLARLSSGYEAVSNLDPLTVRSMMRNGTIAPGQLSPVFANFNPSGYASPPPMWGGPSAAQGRLQQFLAANPFLRQQLEMNVGGRILPGGRNQNQLRVQPFMAGASPAVNQNGATSTASELLAGWLIGAGNRGGSPFMGSMANGLANVLGGAGGGGGGGFGSPGNAVGNASFVGGSTGSILSDSSLTVEDKVTLMIMQIMKQMDKQIEQQANYINALQQQQQGGGGKGGKGGGGAPSIDVETMKLKRLIDKRSQMFDMLRQIIDKYNETAKNIIQSIGR